MRWQRLKIRLRGGFQAILAAWKTHNQLPQIEAALGEEIRAAPQAAATPPVAGADPKPDLTLRRLVAFVRERFGRRCCRETVRSVLRPLDLSWKKAKKLLGRADE
jgi:transposase